MSILSKGYRQYQGVLKGRLHKIWAIAYNAFRVGLSGKRAIFLFILCNLPVLAFTLMLIFMAIFAPGGVAQLLLNSFGTLDVALYSIVVVTLNQGTLFLPLVFISALNAGSIANEKKHNSLALYLAKPVDRLDYILGKYLGMILISSFVTAIPWFVFMVVFSLISGYSGAQFLDTLWVYLSMLAVSLLVIVFIGSIVLLFSSLTDQSILAGIIAILIIYLPSVIATIIGLVIEASWIQYFSASSLLSAVAYLLFNKPSTEDGFINFFQPEISSWGAIAILLAIALSAFLLMVYNLYKEEIQ
ncbi:MAG: ABC transporter permease subunit [Candidatus Heimdallarchaeota archaeon]|nr:ABC transporter permease subunit [Candidatus Heimdallarchaeota archaeon]